MGLTLTLTLTLTLMKRIGWDSFDNDATVVSGGGSRRSPVGLTDDERRRERQRMHTLSVVQPALERGASESEALNLTAKVALDAGVGLEEAFDTAGMASREVPEEGASFSRGILTLTLTLTLTLIGGPEEGEA